MFSRRQQKLAFPVPLLTTAAILAVVMALGLPSNAAGANEVITYQRLTFLPVNASIRAEVADTERAREKGLMYRKSLGKDRGMIFYFDQTGYHAFYMYNTRIPLSVIFLNESLRIVDIQEMVPCMEREPSACPVYTPHAACKYVIEVNQAFVRKHRIKIGDEVRIQK
jgi:uncharacterized membrane protein (UPF0127 family)